MTVDYCELSSSVTCENQQYVSASAAVTQEKAGKFHDTIIGLELKSRITIDPNAFQASPNLNYVEGIDRGLTLNSYARFDEYSFEGNKNLNTVNLTGTLVVLRNYSLANCPNLHNVVFGKVYGRYSDSPTVSSIIYGNVFYGSNILVLDMGTTNFYEPRMFNGSSINTMILGSPSKFYFYEDDTSSFTIDTLVVTDTSVPLSTTTDLSVLADRVTRSIQTPDGTCPTNLINYY